MVIPCIASSCLVLFFVVILQGNKSARGESAAGNITAVTRLDPVAVQMFTQVHQILATTNKETKIVSTS